MSSTTLNDLPLPFPNIADLSTGLDQRRSLKLDLTPLVGFEPLRAQIPFLLPLNIPLHAESDDEEPYDLWSEEIELVPSDEDELEISTAEVVERPAETTNTSTDAFAPASLLAAGRIDASTQTEDVAALKRQGKTLPTLLRTFFRKGEKEAQPEQRATKGACRAVAAKAAACLRLVGAKARSLWDRRVGRQARPDDKAYVAPDDRPKAVDPAANLAEVSACLEIMLSDAGVCPGSQGSDWIRLHGDPRVDVAIQTRGGIAAFAGEGPVQGDVVGPYCKRQLMALPEPLISEEDAEKILGVRAANGGSIDDAAWLEVEALLRARSETVAITSLFARLLRKIVREEGVMANEVAKLIPLRSAAIRHGATYAETKAAWHEWACTLGEVLTRFNA